MLAVVGDTQDTRSTFALHFHQPVALIYPCISTAKRQMLLLLLHYIYLVPLVNRYIGDTDSLIIMIQNILSKYKVLLNGIECL